MLEKANCPPALFSPAEKMIAEPEALHKLSLPKFSYAAEEIVFEEILNNQIEPVIKALGRSEMTRVFLFGHCNRISSMARDITATGFAPAVPASIVVTVSVPEFEDARYAI